MSHPKAEETGCRECDQLVVVDQLALHIRRTFNVQLSINIHVLNAIYMYYTLAHRSGCELLQAITENTELCFFFVAIAVRCMVVV